jgi:hypothetical protein
MSPIPCIPAVLGTLELARGEQLFATRFDGGRAYVVTFEQVDPLWIIDLSDPAHPTVAGELEVPGFATQIVADGDRLVCLGIDTETWNTIVSLFDVSNPSSPALLDREDIGSASTDAHWERKAFGVTPGLILVPSWDGLSVIARDATTLTQRGKLTVAGGALRGFALGTDLVAAGSEEAVVADAATLDVRGRVTVAENVIDAGPSRRWAAREACADRRSREVRWRGAETVGGRALCVRQFRSGARLGRRGSRRVRRFVLRADTDRLRTSGSRCGRGDLRVVRSLSRAAQVRARTAVLQVTPAGANGGAAGVGVGFIAPAYAGAGRGNDERRASSWCADGLPACRASLVREKLSTVSS